MTQTCIDLSALMVPFQVCQFNYRHQCTPHHQRCRFLNRVLIKSWMVHLFSLFDFDFCPQNIFSTLPRSILNELGQEKTAIFLDDSQMASSLHGRAVTWICGWHGELCSPISGSVPEPIHRFMPWRKIRTISPNSLNLYWYCWYHVL